MKCIALTIDHLNAERANVFGRQTQILSRLANVDLEYIQPTALCLLLQLRLTLPDGLSGFGSVAKGSRTGAAFMIGSLDVY